jgi:EmrB/QacA subfamily drug resistance transporter
MSFSAADNTVPAPTRRKLGLMLALLAFASLITSLDYNIVYVALPEIGSGLRFSASNLQWVISAYAVAFGGFLLLGGRACDLLGRRRMFVLGLGLYAVSSLAGGLATGPELLIGARAVQGLAGAFLFPATLSLVNTSFAEGRDRNRALSTWAAAGGGGMILGSLLGGLLTQAFGWQAVFYVNVPLAAAAAVLAFWLIAPDAVRPTGRRFDLPGALTGTLGTTLLVFTLVQGPASGWTSPAILAAATASAALLAAFVVIEKRSTDPLMPLRLLRTGNLRTGVVTTFLFMATFGTQLYFLTVYFQNVHGYNALQTGIAFLIPMGTTFVGSKLGGFIATRFGARTTLIGALAAGAVGTVLLALGMSPDGSYPVMLPGLVIFGFSQGIIYTTMFSATATGISSQEQGIASSMASTGQQVGSAMGLAVLVGIANAATTGRTGEALRVATSSGLRTAVLLCAAGIVVMVLVALTFRRTPAAVELPAHAMA